MANTLKFKSIKIASCIEEPCVGKPHAGFCGGCHSNETLIIKEV